MISKYLMLFLLMIYVSLIVTCILDQKWALMWYWIGAYILNFAVYTMSYC